MNQRHEKVAELQCIEAHGPWPFITRRVYLKPDHSRTVWHSRHHRKGLLAAAAARSAARMPTWVRCLWMPRELNWWIGVIFAIGALLFASASVLSLAPKLAQAWSLDTAGINRLFFAGSIPFTIAAYLQLFQSANVDEFLGEETGPAMDVLD